MTEFTSNPDEDSVVNIFWSSFLLRFYREGAGEWRGEVVHLQTQDKRLVATLEQIHEFFQKHAPGLDDQSRVNPKPGLIPDSGSN